MFMKILAAALIALGASAGAAHAQTVTSPADSGPGTLRRAINLANANANLSVITFNLPAAGTVITPTADLPALTAPVEIDGYTQPGSTQASGTSPATPLVVIEAVNTTRALELNTDDSLIQGLTILDSSGAAAADGIQVAGDDNRIEGNHVGTSTTGLSKGFQNLTTGVAISGDRNVVGGEAIEDGNLISESLGDGVTIAGAQNKVLGNRIGVPYGAGALGNAGNGVALVGNENLVSGNDSSDNVAGVFVDGTSNTIMANTLSGNSDSGVQIAAGQNNRVEGNGIGSATLPNDYGVLVQSSFNFVEGNAVTGNNAAGVKLDGDLVGPPPILNVVDGNAITGNQVGVVVEDSHRNAITGNAISASTDEGVLIEAVDLANANENRLTGNTIKDNGLSGVRIAAADENLVGEPDEAINIITGNGEDGVTVDTGQDNAVVNNSIYDNGNLGIDLAADGVSPNDGLLDPDPGPNGLQNHPTISGHQLVIVQQGGLFIPKSRISWTLRSAAAADYRLEFYVNDTCAGRGEAKELVATEQVTTDGTGLVQGSVDIAPVDEKVTVTATETDPAGLLLGPTSELSQCG